MVKELTEQEKEENKIWKENTYTKPECESCGERVDKVYHCNDCGENTCGECYGGLVPSLALCLDDDHTDENGNYECGKPIEEHPLAGFLVHYDCF